MAQDYLGMSDDERKKLADQVLFSLKGPQLAQNADYSPEDQIAPMDATADSNPLMDTVPETGVSAGAYQAAQDAAADNQATQPLPIQQLPPQLQAANASPMDAFRQKQDEYSKKAEEAIAEQKKGLGENAAYLQAMQQNAGPSLAPIMNLIDTWTGSKLSQGYTPPVSSKDILALKNLIQQERGGISDKELALLKDQLAPYRLAQQQNIRQELQNQRIAFQAQKNIVEGIKKNPLDAKLITQSNNLVNAVTTSASGKLTPQNFGELQQTARANMGIKGTSIGEERKETFFTGLGIRGGALEQFLTMDPKDIRKLGGQAFLDHLQNMMQTEISNIQGQRDRLINKLAGGYGDILDLPENAAKKKAILDLIATARAQTSAKPLPRISKMNEGEMINPNTRKIEKVPYAEPKKKSAPHKSSGGLSAAEQAELDHLRSLKAGGQ